MEARLKPGLTIQTGKKRPAAESNGLSSEDKRRLFTTWPHDGSMTSDLHSKVEKANN